MDTILDINGIQTITSKESIYKEMIEECEKRIFDLNEVVYEISADSQLCQKFERRIEVYKSIVNRLTQRIHTL